MVQKNAFHLKLCTNIKNTRYKMLLSYLIDQVMIYEKSLSISI